MKWCRSVMVMLECDPLYIMDPLSLIFRTNSGLWF